MALDVDHAAAALLRALDAQPSGTPLLALLQRYAALPDASADVVSASELAEAKDRARLAVVALARLLQQRTVALWVVDHWDPPGTGTRPHACAPAIRCEAGDVSLVPIVRRGPVEPIVMLGDVERAPLALTSSPPLLVPAYLLAQAALVAAWWLLLWTVPAQRAPFVVAGWPETTLLAFALPDVAVLVAGSAAAAFGLRAGRAWARPVVWLVAGAVLYATLWCVGTNFVTGAGWLSTALMLACCAAMAVVVAVVR